MMPNSLFRAAFATIALAFVAASVVAGAPAKSPSYKLLGTTYKLASFNNHGHAMWEFLSNGQTFDNWSTMVTVIDRTDARTAVDLDRLAEGMLTQYKSAHAIILLSRTLRDPAGKPYDYIVAAFNEPAKHRMELDYLKVARGPKNAYLLIYGVTITDKADYRKKAAKYVETHSVEIGKALGAAPTPATSTWPQKAF